MKHLLQSFCTLGAGLLFLAGCQVGPNYKTPRAEVSESFDTGPELLPTTLPAITPTSLAAANQPTTPSSDALAAATRASTQPSAGPVDLTHWWTALDDAELNSLVSRAVASNLDIAIAAERVQEIRETYGAVSDDRPASRPRLAPVVALPLRAETRLEQHQGPSLRTAQRGHEHGGAEGDHPGCRLRRRLGAGSVRSSGATGRSRTSRRGIERRSTEPSAG